MRWGRHVHRHGYDYLTSVKAKGHLFLQLRARARHSVSRIEPALAGGFDEPQNRWRGNRNEVNRVGDAGLSACA